MSLTGEENRLMSAISHATVNEVIHPNPGFAAGDAEQVRHMALVAEGDQRGVHPVLQRRAVFDQMQPPPGDLPLAAELQCGQPDRRDQVPERQLGEHPRVDLG